MSTKIMGHNIETLNSKEDPSNGLTYYQVGEVWLPGIVAAPEEQDTRPFGKYSRLRKAFLKENHPHVYMDYLMSGTLDKHLKDVEEEAWKRIDQLTPQMEAEAGVTEELRRTDPLRWAGLKNNVRASAEEIIYQELIYV